MLSNLQQWYANNLILVSSHYSFGAFNAFYSNQTLWIINPKDIEEFKRQNEAANERYNLGTTKEGQEYITSTYGLILVGEVDNKTDTFTYDAYKVLKVELSESLGYLSGHFKNNMGDQSTEKLMAAHVEKVKQRAEQEAKKKAISEAYSKRKADLHAELLSLSTDVEWPAMVQTMFSFDHSYNYSDDGKYWSSTNARRESINASVKRFGQDGDVLLRRIAHVVLN